MCNVSIHDHLVECRLLALYYIRIPGTEQSEHLKQYVICILTGEHVHQCFAYGSGILNTIMWISDVLD